VLLAMKVRGHPSTGVVRIHATYGSTSWRSLVSTGSEFLAMLPLPPRPVVTTAVLSVGVWRSSGWRGTFLLLSRMLPAPPRPDDWRFDMMGIKDRGGEREVCQVEGADVEMGCCAFGDARGREVERSRAQVVLEQGETEARGLQDKGD